MHETKKIEALEEATRETLEESCCSARDAESCCAPEDKEGCCGTAATTNPTKLPRSCGC